MSEDRIEALKKEIAELFQSLKTERDELRVRIHLAQADAQDEWAKLEKSWGDFEEKAAVVTEVAADASKEVGTAARLLGDELKKGYGRVRDAIASQS